jgi:uptake hydrogenase large subunit
MKRLHSSSLSGSVDLDLDWHDGRLRQVGVRASRPPAARLLRGLPVGEARALVPRLFSLCGKAQAAVAGAALAAASGEAIAVDTVAARREAIQEHLWRLLLDWPQLLQKPPAAADFAAWYKRLQGPLSDELADALARFVAQLDLDPLLDGVRPFERSDALLPALLGMPDPALLREAFAGADEAFAQRPTFAGRVAETGVLARHATAPAVGSLLAAGRPLAARIMARHLELGAAVAGLAGAAEPLCGDSPTPGQGLAVVWTARGLLVHRAQVDAGRVLDYLVIAPTEWNFHPASAWLAALRDVPAPTREAAERLVRAWVLALDPCVSATINFGEATETL